MRLRILFCWIAFLLAASSFGADLYVTDSGSGLQDGTSAADSLSVAQFNASALPLEGNTAHFYGPLVSQVAPKSGFAPGAGALTLDLSGSSCETAVPCIRMPNRAYINLVGGTFNHDGTAITFDNVATSHDILISGWSLKGTDAGGAALVMGNFAYNLTIAANHIENGSIIYAGTTRIHDIKILNNYCKGAQNVTQQFDIIQFGDAYSVSILGNHLIQRAPGASSGRHNDIIQAFKSGASLSGNPRDWTIAYNLLELDVTSGSGDNSWMMMEEMGGFLKVFANVFYGRNTVQTGGNGTVVHFGLVDALYSYFNNTVITKKGPNNTIRFQDAGLLNGKNNLAVSAVAPSGTFWQWTTPGVFDFNYGYLTGPSCTSTIAGPHGSCALNPLLTDFANDDFTLSAGSPLLTAGDASIGPEFALGIAPGATWPNPQLVARSSSAWGVGAFVGTAVVAPPPPPPPPPPPVDLPPIPGNNGILGKLSVSSSSLLLLWTAATDDNPGVLYEVRRSFLDNMRTIDEAEANGTVIKPYALDLTAFKVTGLKVANVPYFVVIAKDSKGQKAFYPSVKAEYGWH